MKFGMGNRDQRLGSLAQSLAVEIRDSILGYHVVDIGAAGDHARAGVQNGANAGDCAVFRSGWERDDRLPAIGAGRAPGEIDLPAEAAVGAAADGVGADLSG